MIKVCFNGTRCKRNKQNIYTLNRRSSCGPNEPFLWVMSLEITIISRPSGYSGVLSDIFHATMPTCIKIILVVPAKQNLCN